MSLSSEESDLALYVHVFSFHWQPVQTQRFLAPSAPLSCFPLPWVVTLELLGTEGRWFHLSVMVVFQGVRRTRHTWRCGLARDNRGSSALSRSTTLQRRVAMARPCWPSHILQQPLATRHLSRRQDSNHRPSRLEVTHATDWATTPHHVTLVTL